MIAVGIEQQLFYWTGAAFFITAFTVLTLGIATKLLWMVLNGFESAMARNAEMFAAYLRILAKKHWKGDEEDLIERTWTSNGYRISIDVEDISQKGDSC